MAEDEALTTKTISQNQGGWMTIPFIIGTKLAIGVAAFGLSSNLTVYLIEQFNFSSIDATQINNIVTGCSQLAPVVGALVSDSGPGCFNVICGASVVSFLGTLLFMLISFVPSLRPPPCLPEICQAPATWQLAILYTATALILAGLGGTRFISATFGAAQLDNIEEQATFFNWYVMSLYITVLIGLTVVVYVQADVGWISGFSLSAVLSAVGLLVFLLGSRYYRHPKPQKNPFLMLFRRRKMVESFDDTLRYYDRLDDGSTHESQSPIFCPSSNDQTEGQETTEDFRSLISLIPLMSTGILVSISISMITSLSILQALVMNRKIFLNFAIPAASMSIFSVLTTIISVPLLEHVIFPVYHRLTHRRQKPLHLIGIGSVIIILSAVTAAAFESRRLKALSGSTEPMPVLWLVPGLALVGLGEALHFPGLLAFYHQELPDSLSSLVTGMIALVIAIGFFASSAVMALLRRITPWLQDDANMSRLDNVYWMLAVVGALNVGYFLICAKLYKRKRIEEV